MTVTVDAASAPQAQSGASFFAANGVLTVGSGTNRALLVQVITVTVGATPTSVISAEWDVFGTPQFLTQISAFTDTTSFAANAIRGELWGLIAPTSGNLTLEVVLDASASYFIVQATSFEGAKQVSVATTFINASDTAGNSTTASISISGVAGDIAIAQHVNALKIGGFSAVDQTQIGISNTTSFNWASNYGPGSASTTLTATNASSTPWHSQGVDVVSVVIPPDPRAQYDWPNPQRVSRSFGFTDSFKLPLGTILPPRQTDWPNPRGPRQPVSSLTHSDSFKLPLQQVMPPRQTEWPVPQAPVAFRRGPQDCVLGSTWQLTAPAPPQPGSVTGWFNPWGPRPLRPDCIGGSTGVLTAPLPSLPASRQLDWPNPTRAKPPVVADWQFGVTTWLNAPLPSLPASRQLDWPNPPRGPRQPVVDWLQTTRLIDPPVNSFDWPNPRGPRRNPQDHFELGNNLPAPVLIPTMRQADWPNPTLARRPLVRDWLMGSTWLLTAPPPPFPASRQRDFPNPRGAMPNQRLGMSNSGVAFTLVPPHGPTETLKNLSGRARYLKNEVRRVRYVQKL